MSTGLRGTDQSQDTRFKDKEAISIKNTKFPDHFSQKVDLRKVNISVLRQWVTEKITELLRFEDDVVVEYAYGLLENKDDPMPDPRKMQVNLTGFMDKHGAAAFMSELWTLLLSAQSTIGGVPAEFIAKKKAELEKAQREGRSVPSGRGQAMDFDGRGPHNGLPPRPGQGGPPDLHRGPPGRGFDDRDGPRRGGYGGGRGGFNERLRDSGYGNRRGDGFGGLGGPGGASGPGGPGGYGRDRDNGYGNRGPPPNRDFDRSRPRSRSPPRYRRHSPSPARSPSPPRRRRSPSPRRRSPSPRRRNQSVTPPLGSRRPRDDSLTPPRRRSPSPPLRRRDEPARGRTRSRTPTSDAGRRRARSPSRSASVTPPRRRRHSSTPPPPRRRRDSSTPPPRRQADTPARRRDGSTPPRRRREGSTPPRRVVRDRSDCRSPSPKRRRASPARSITPPRDEEFVKKGRGRFTVEDEQKEERPKKKLEGPLAKSKWAD